MSPVQPRPPPPDHLSSFTCMFGSKPPLLCHRGVTASPHGPNWAAPPFSSICATTTACSQRPQPAALGSSMADQVSLADCAAAACLVGLVNGDQLWGGCKPLEHLHHGLRSTWRASMIDSVRKQGVCGVRTEHAASSVEDAMACPRVCKAQRAWRATMSFYANAA